MRTDITIGDYHRVFDSPEGVYLVGVTVIRDGRNTFSTINNLVIDGVGSEDEEIELDCGVKLIFHYYSSPFLGWLMGEFAGFEGMKFIEVREDDMYLFQTV